MPISAEAIINRAVKSGLEFILEDGVLRLRHLRSESIDPELLDLIKEHREGIRLFLSDTLPVKSEYRSIRKVAVNGNVALSFAQERLWFVDRLQGSLAYHLPFVFRLQGRLRADVLEQCFRQIVERHQVLRTVLLEEEGRGYQHVRTSKDWAMEQVDRQEVAARYGSLDAYINALSTEPFHLGSDYMLRVHLIRVSDEEHVLVSVLHHIASDGWSLGILVGELAALYNAALDGQEARLPPLPVQYTDYALWQREQLNEALPDRQLSYWKKQLQHLQPVEFPTDHPRPLEGGTQGGRVCTMLSAELLKKIKYLSQANGTTLFMTLLAGFQALLYRYTGQNDLSVGTPVAGRQQHELEGLIGFFVNTLVLRTSVDGGQSFTGLLQEVKRTTLEAYENGQLPFEKIVEVLGAPRDLSRHPLFQILFSVQNNPVQEFKLNGVSIEVQKPSTYFSRFDLNIEIQEIGDALQVELFYSKALFRPLAMERLLAHYTKLLSSAVDQPGLPVRQLTIHSSFETALLLEVFNETGVKYDAHGSFLELFEWQAATTPKATAVVFRGEEWSYEELDGESNRLAHYLLEKGLQRGAIVPLYMERSPEMLMAMLAVLKAGGAYLPLDVAHPEDRIQYVLRDCAASLVISHASSMPVCLGAEERTVIGLELIKEELNELPFTRPDVLLKASDLAYVMYTSGSTGQPKGVMVEHGNLLNFLQSMASELGFTASDRMLALTTYSFDISGLELYLPLMQGGSICLADRTDAVDGKQLFQLLHSSRSTYMQATPSGWQLLLESGWKNEEPVKILVGGEALPEALKERLVSVSADVWNLYGPTETTIWSASARLQPGVPVHIGKPIANTQIYILDGAGSLSPLGVPGELCIGGAGVARGYLNRPELTAEKFIQNPFGEGRIYRTGDLARWKEDGTLEYLGRLDDQVKIRGHRIELGEVETVLNNAPGVRQSAVVATAAGSSKMLVAYVVTDGWYDQAAAMAHLKRFLPEYMVPQVMIGLDAFPLNSSGKVNRKALAQREVQQAAAHEYVAPQTGAQQAVALIWQELLNVDAVGIHDNFFELGGHSLLAMRLSAAVHQKLSRRIEVRDVFLFPTVAQLAQLIEGKEERKVSVLQAGHRSVRLPLSFAQERLWFIDRLQGSTAYHMSFVFRIDGKLDLGALEASLAQLVKRHETLRTVFVEEEGKAYQKIKTADPWKLQYTGTEETALITDLEDHLARVSMQPFLLGSDYLFRVHVLERSGEEFYLVAVLHHIISDGWSIGVLVQELSELYEANVQNRAAALQPLPLQYADFALWQRNYFNAETLQPHLDYWKDKLQGVTPLTLPFDHPRLPEESGKGALATRTLPRELLQKILALGHREGSTLFMTLLAAFKLLLRRYTGESDVCVGSSTAGRLHREVEGLIGFFINTLVLRTEVRDDVPFSQLLQEVRATTLEAYEHQEAPFERIVEALGVERTPGRNPLYNILFTVQNNVDAGGLDLGPDVRLERLLPGNSLGAQFDLNVNAYETADGLAIEIIYEKYLYNKNTIEKLLAHYEALLQDILVAADAPVGHLSLMAEGEERLLKEFASSSPVPVNETILQVLQRQAVDRNTAPALLCGDRTISYEQLDACSSRLCRYLRSKGVEEGSIVGVLMDNSPELVMAVWAIWKAGAAYVPVDPAHPQSRISYILEDTEAVMLLTNSASGHLAPEGILNLCIDKEWAVVDEFSSDAVASNVSLSSMAYVIYTSGSTGQPKGVAVEHGNLIQYLLYAKENYLNKEQNTIGSGSYVHLSPSFDASLTALWATLVAGRKVVIAKNAGPEVFSGKDFSLHAPYDFIKLTPAHLALLEPDFEGMFGPVAQRLVLGGEALQPAHIDWLKDRDITIINEYGPTEATVGCSVYSFNSADKGVESGVHGYSIGRPVAGSQIYIVDQNIQLCPIDVPGELCIGGGQVAREYMNKPELTAEKFIQNPFGEGRIYRTGDIARWRADGLLEYLGRGDDQVKIKGYRIELGEVETALASAPGVRQAVAVAGTLGSGARVLAAYIVTDAAYDEAPVVEYLRTRLPEYMLPTVFIQLEALPLNSSGKIDRKTLAQRELEQPSRNSYAAPQTATEQLLAGIWEDLLGLEKVGVHHNFFELGGDSIISVQMVSRARREGLQLQVGDVFTHQTISRLAQSLKLTDTVPVEIPETQLSGPAGLLPIQKWFFSNNAQNPVEVLSHFNQSILLSLDKSIDAARLQQAFEKLVEQHDALRFKYTIGANGWQQEYQPSISFRINTEQLHSSALADEVETLANHYQQSLNIAEGKLLQVVLMQTPGTEVQNRLLIVIHHLAVDGVSWRILLEDLEQLLSDDAAILPAKKNSYRDWYETLQNHTTLIADEGSYWNECSTGYQPLPSKEEAPAQVRAKDIAQFSIRLSAPQTKALLQQAPRIYKTGINDLLLAALSQTLYAWTGREETVIGLEGHGREQITPNTDLSRTAGWFTSLYPVVLKTNGAGAWRQQILQTKETLRQVPGNGIAYGLLRYSKNSTNEERDPWDLLFNYLGQTDAVLRSNLLSRAKEPEGKSYHDEAITGAPLAINSQVANGELIIEWNYSTRHFAKDTMEGLAASYINDLKDLIDHCLQLAPHPPLAFIPNDFGLSKEITVAGLDRFFAQQKNPDQIEGLSRLSPLQQGLLFHSLYEQSGSAYTEQFECRLQITDLSSFYKSWQLALQSHSILRTAFLSNAFSVPVQVIYKKVSLPIEYVDARPQTSEEQQALVQKIRLQDWQRGLDVTAAPLMRLTLVQLDDHSYQLIWIAHHLVLDGWSTPVLMGEVLQSYEALVRKQPVAPVAEDRYEDFIRYIGKKEKQGLAYWSDYLKNFSQGCLLPFVEAATDRNLGVEAFREERLCLDESTAAALRQYAQGNHLTINTLIEGVWAYLLFQYTHEHTVAFGVTVSGRPDDLGNVEKKVGMFTNTIPFAVAVDPESEIVDWLHGLQQSGVKNLEHQYTALTDVQRSLGLSGDLFDTMITFQNYPMEQLLRKGQWQLQPSHFKMHEQTSNYPLSLRVLPDPSVSVQFIYKSSAIDVRCVRMVCGQFGYVLHQIVSGAKKIKDLQLLSAEERQKIFGFNNPVAPYAPGQNLVSLFNTQVKKNGAAIAVKFGDRSLSYLDLDQRSGRLARFLRSQGIGRGSIVPVCIGRSPEMIIAIMAVLKAGAAYTPIDPAYPAERIGFMLQDTGATLVLSTSQQQALLMPLSPGRIVCLDSDEGLINDQSADPLNLQISERDLAYVIYTSGSTGRPKGVMIEHKGVVNLVLNQVAPLNLRTGIRVFQFASFSFDASCHEIFTTLMHGGVLVLAPQEVLMDPARLCALLDQEDIELVTLPPSYQSAIQDEVYGLKTVISAGEALDRKLAAAIEGKGVHLINAYGPTENTVSSILTTQPLHQSGAVTIGRPLQNVQAYIVNEELEPVTIGVVGELCLGGAQLARGYLNQPSLTGQRFIRNPFGEGRLYRTGDLCRWLPDGQVEYIGRKDDQVKIRGYRIELGEVEAVLQLYAGVGQSAVVAQEDATGKRLVAFVLPNEQYDRELLNEFLHRRLPDHMIPSRVVEVQSMPLTVNGKVDRKALQQQSWTEAAAVEEETTELENSLLDIWKEVLEVSSVRATDNFFDLGGHSLLAIKVVSAMRRQLDLEISIKDIFDWPTVRQLAARLEPATGAGLPPLKKLEATDPIPLSFAQERLWFIDRLQGSEQYHIPYVLQLQGVLNREALELAIREVMNRHQSLRTTIREEEGRAYQFVRPAEEWKLDWVESDEVMKHADMETYLQELVSTPFDLSKDFPLKAWVLRQDNDQHILILLMHHITADGWSVPILSNELARSYNSFAKGSKPALEELPFQYGDYAAWQRNFLSSKLYESKLVYWKEKLVHTPTVELSTDFVRPAELGLRGAGFATRLNNDTLQALYALSRREGVTLFMTLLGVFKILLHRYTGQDKITVGSPEAGRYHKEVEGLIGFFVNALPLQTTVQGDMPFTAFLQEVKTATVDAYANGEVPFDKLVEALGIPRDLSRSPLFQIMFVLQQVQKQEPVALHGLQIKEVKVTATTAKYDLSVDIQEDEQGLHMQFIYNSDLFRKGTITRMMEHYEQLLVSVLAHPEQEIGLLQMLTQKEQTILLDEFNSFEPIASQNKTILDLLSAQVAARGVEEAIVYEGVSISYQDLEERTNQLAHYLISVGVKAEVVVPILMERGSDMLIALLAVLKAGGAYVPLDPAYPVERLQYMLEDTEAGLLLTDAACHELAQQVSGSANVINLSQQSSTINSYSASAPDVLIEGHQLAYIIYTSGSTGKPKGVMVEHKGLLSMVENHQQILELTPGCRTLEFASFSFDGSCQEIFTTLCSGGVLIIASTYEIHSLDGLTALLKDQRIQMATLPPSYQRALKEQLTSLQTLYSAGEALQKDVALYLMQKGVRIINGYGPTENTVTISLTTDPLHNDGTVSIGRPLKGVHVYILDKNGQPCPLGVQGELCVAGVQLARGYLNRHELTREKFVANPFGEGRLYRTGDLAKWREDGTLEYLGRLDDQVKIRGYRIELGEVEAALMAAAGVEQGVVVVREEEETGQKRLVGYVVTGESYDQLVVKEYLQSVLPEYMVPQTIIELEQLPLNNSGKVDRKTLSQREVQATNGSEYAAPQTETEKLLAGIWEELLGVEKVGLHDNFFELGGDSIITIQVVSRARKKGMHLQPKDLFLHQDIAALAKNLDRVAMQTTVSADQGLITGPCGLLPIQQWFFSNNGDKPVETLSHFNQSVLLSLDKNIEFTALQTAFDKLVAHHDVLRFIYERGADGQWIQVYQKEINIKVEHSSISDNISPANSIEQLANQYQQSLNIEKGKLLHVVLIRTPDEEKQNRLLIIIHHLAVDGVSWRILLEDLEQLLNHGNSSLPAKTSSYKDWQSALQTYAAAQQQQAYWQKQAEAYKPLQPEHPAAGERGQLSIHLGEEQTRALLQQAQKAYNTGINDLLLSALGRTLCEWQEVEEIVIGLEGHGREQSIAQHIDLSRTVGWFTTHYPVKLIAGRDKDLRHLILQTKELLRAIPDKGLGYGILKHLNGQNGSKDSWDVVFNYLGQADKILTQNGLLGAANEPTGNNVDNKLYKYKIEINSIVSDGSLHLEWSYDTRFGDETIETLATNYLTHLEQLIDHTLQAQKPGNTLQNTIPADFGLSNISTFEEWEAFVSRLSTPVQVQSIYPLSPLQEGILFHSLYDASGTAYVEQFRCSLSHPDMDLFKQAWAHLVEKHTILRTAFYPNALGKPVQVVSAHTPLSITTVDHRHYEPGEANARLDELVEADLQLGFRFEKAPLMRLTLVQLNDSDYHMIWTFHHLILDGWSVQVITKEFLKTYDALLNKHLLPTIEDDRYGDYIQYIQQHRPGEKEYWARYLSPVEEGSLLPFVAAESDRNKGIGSYLHQTLVLSEEETGTLNDFAQQHRLTMNTVVQSAWAYLLSRYTGRKEVVYGITVSGRPEDMDNVEDKAGLYINTVPLVAQIPEEATLLQWMQSIQEDQLQSRTYQYTSLSDIQNGAGLQGTLFDTLLTFQNYPIESIPEAGASSLNIRDIIVHEHTNYPLNIVVGAGRELSVRFTYNATLIDERVMERMRNHFLHLLQQLPSKAQHMAASLQLLTPPELQAISKFNGSYDLDAANETVIDLFRRQAEKTPNAPCVRFEDQALSYRELDERTNQLAHYLLAQDIQPEAPVPVCLERSLDMIVALLGIWKAGAVYVPIDPAYPQERINFLLEDTGAEHVLIHSSLAEKFEDKMKVHALDELKKNLVDLPSTVPNSLPSADQLAYVIYTSGSTGRPKGVQNAHRGLTNRLQWSQEIFGLDGSDAFLQKTTSCFDVSLWELLWPLTCGARLVFARPGGGADPQYLKELIEKEKLTLVHFVPSLLDVFLAHLSEGDCPALKYVLCSGEALKPAHVLHFREKLAHAGLHNLYGPTEAAIEVSYWRAPQNGLLDRVPIGRPVRNTALYIVDDDLRPVPIGVPGELCIGGIQVARGYLNLPELTAQKFLDNPFGEGRIYKTGDRCRWSEEGVIEYLGRGDDQVKIRGYRIELGEIEKALRQSPGVRQAAVLAAEDGSNSLKLFSYIVCGEGYDRDAVMQSLRDRLPEYMIPSLLIAVPSIPTLASGKLDRKALLAAASELSATRSKVLPRTEAEEALASIWQELLGLEEVGVYDQFFEIGGHSLLAMRMNTAIKKRFDLSIPMNVLFRFTCISDLAKYIELQRVAAPLSDFEAFTV